MAKNILVATPQTAFGELLRLSLEESGRYRVRLVQTGREALASADNIVFSLAILDAALDGPPFPYVTQGLRKRVQNLPLLIIPSQAGDPSAEVTAASADGWIGQPFYAPQILEKIDALTAEAPVPAQAESQIPAEPPQPTLQDATLATQHLEEFLQDSSAPGVLVVRMRQPWASAGELNQETLNEVASLLTRYTEANEGVDLARYVHLQSDGGEYLIYATPLSESLVLAMVYQMTTPMTVIRAQAGRLARLLRQATPAAVFTSALPAVPPASPPVPPDTATPPLPAMPASRESDEEDDSEYSESDLEADAVRLVDLLSEMPEPNPDPQPAAEPGDWVHTAPEAAANGEGFVFPWEREAPLPPEPAQAAAPAPPAPAGTNLEKSNGKQGSADSSRPSLDATRPNLTGPLASTQASPTAATPMRPPTPVEQTRPSLSRGYPPEFLPGSTQPVVNAPSYTCVLVPRLAEHGLVEPLAERLSDWLPQLCLAYGWRMQGMAIQPDYLQWTVQVAPASSPGNIIRMVRQQTSRRIFAQFPAYEVENPSGDFWAPGYLIISGIQPSAYHWVQDFIQQTRLRQNLY